MNENAAADDAAPPAPAAPTITPRLIWYEVVWACVPLLLVIGGGGGGLVWGALGGAAVYGNLTLLRTRRAGPGRWVLTALVNVASLALAGGLLTLALRNRR